MPTNQYTKGDNSNIFWQDNITIIAIGSKFNSDDFFFFLLSATTAESILHQSAWIWPGIVYHISDTFWGQWWRRVDVHVPYPMWNTATNYKTFYNSTFIITYLCFPNEVLGTYCFYSVSYHYYSFSPALFCPGLFSETTQGISMKLSRMIV
jgi:hypothetical protein